MNNHCVNVRLPAELHRRLDTLAAEGILGRTIEEVVIHLARNALHRDWFSRRAAPEKPKPPDPRPSPAPANYAGLPSGRRLLRLPEVSRLVGLGRSSIYRLVSLGAFPAPRKLGTRSVAWLQSEVESWIDARDQAP